MNLREVLVRPVGRVEEEPLQQWNEIYGKQDKSLSIDGKTMCNAIDEQGYQTHIMSAIGHQTKSCYTQKK